MGLKKKLALATSAFVSMSAASLATACPNELTARRRLRRRRASVPVRIAPERPESPGQRAHAVEQGPSGARCMQLLQSRCNFVRCSKRH